jgi:hypothetical protein
VQIPVSYNGRGTVLQVSQDGTNFLSTGQLTKIEPGGSKQKIVDATDLGAAQLGFTTPLAVQVESGELACEGVLNPQDPVTQLLGQLHGSLALASFLVTLSDNLTSYYFQGYVSDWKPFSVALGKMLRISWKLRIVGALCATTDSAFQPNAFQPQAFQIVQV